MTIDEAQRDNRIAYGHGGPGAVVSGLVWLVAAIVLQNSGVATSFAVLFIGGIFIFPISLLIERYLLKCPLPSAGNSLGRVALESTIAMIGGLFVAWLFMPFKPDWVLPLAAIAVGTHYFPFRSLYGDMIYWALGALITIAGFLGIYMPTLLPGSVAFFVAAIELAFGAWLTRQSFKQV